jgi:hypothetical protein
MDLGGDLLLLLGLAGRVRVSGLKEMYSDHSINDKILTSHRIFATVYPTINRLSYGLCQDVHSLSKDLQRLFSKHIRPLFEG